MAKAALTDLETAVLERIQTGFPLCHDPYAEIARPLGSTREAVYASVSALRGRGVIRRIGGSFDGRALGFVSVLVAARVAPEQLLAVAAVAGAYAEVTHSYEREGHYNFWFTVIAESPERLETILAHVRQQSGVEALHPLPALRTFKIRVDFHFGTLGEGTLDPAPYTLHPIPYTLHPIDAPLIERLCGDIGGDSYPFRALAAEFDISEDDLLARIDAYRVDGRMRRFGAILRHREAGFTANGMSVWNVPDADVERVGAILAASPEITHCYERARIPDWPYNVYAMIHGTSEAACRAVAESLSTETGIRDFTILFSLREFKKSSMVYRL